MNILPQNHNTSFYGIYKSSPRINEIQDEQVSSKRVSIVELNPKDKEDLKTLSKISSSWKKAEFSDNIYCTAVASTNKYANASKYKFYVLTTQNKDYNKINHKEVLAQAQLSFDEYYNNNKVWIDYLQVKPDDKHGAKNRKFTKAGTALVDFFKKEFKGNKLILAPIEESIPFHEKQGFKFSSGETTMEYQA